jgi:broad specificity phosphatase PhoE
VLRHGTRLDAADKQWHLTSPTPYDPPLTYGGWIQSRALGARIASLLRSRETDDYGILPDTVGGDGHQVGNGRRRRHKVIIHTSPFLRCVQTAVAISSGLAQSPVHSYIPSSHSTNAAGARSSPSIRPTLATESPRLAPILEPFPTPALSSDAPAEPQIKKSILRVDAFLGEWLTPDYFELITPPPSSIMMVAGAKADLLRREDYSNLVHFREATNLGTVQGFPGGWGSPVAAPVVDSDDGPLSSMTPLSQALPRRDRTSSLSSVGSVGSRHNGKNPMQLSNVNSQEYGVYHPPVPSYAISNSEAIPPGFVSHARDACVLVDYQWDSMREPQNCGNGGEYGEEWSSMHKRFRRGLQNLVQWYGDQEETSRLAMKLPTTNGGTTQSTGSSPSNDDTDLVIILVTHGAGCNALIGALTNQPVLLDVGMASLTMAVQKVSLTNTPAATPTSTPKSHSRQASQSVAISEEYEVKLVANTEHLRSSKSSTPSSSRAPSQSGGTTARQKVVNTGGKFIDGNHSIESRSLATQSKFGSLHRAASAATTPIPRTYTTTTGTSFGLWSAPQAADDEPSDEMFLNFGDVGTSQQSKTNEFAVEEAAQLEGDDVPPLGGLWGMSKPPGEAERMRDLAPKRRWTLNEPGMV